MDLFWFSWMDSSEGCIENLFTELCELIKFWNVQEGRLGWKMPGFRKTLFISKLSLPKQLTSVKTKLQIVIFFSLVPKITLKCIKLYIFRNFMNIWIVPWEELRWKDPKFILVSNIFTNQKKNFLIFCKLSYMYNFMFRLPYFFTLYDEHDLKMDIGLDKENKK